MKLSVQIEKMKEQEKAQRPIGSNKTIVEKKPTEEITEAEKKQMRNNSLF